MTTTTDTGAELAAMHDELAEQVVVGSMLLDEDVAAKVLGILSAADFWMPRHQLIVGVIAEKLYKEPLAGAAMVAHLLAAGLLDQVGGHGYLSDLRLSGMPASVEWHANRVASLSKRRRLEETLIRAQQAVRDPGLDVDDAVGRVQGWVTDATTREAVDVDNSLFHDDQAAILDRLRNPDPYAGISTGLGSLDDVIHRLRPQQLVMIAARPGMGKSVLAADIARHAAWREAEPVLFVSLEMSREEVQARMLSAEADVPLELLVNPPAGGVPESQVRKVEKVLADTDGSWLHLHTEGTVTVADIRARAVRLQRTVGLGLIVVDYLQLLTPSVSNSSRTVEVSQISRDLKLLAMDLGVPVVACSQLNRESEGRATKRPQLSDLRESGSLEQDSNIVILLHREAYYDETIRPGEVDLMVVKNRNGQTKTVVAAAQLHKARFVDMGVPAGPV